MKALLLILPLALVLGCEAPKPPAEPEKKPEAAAPTGGNVQTYTPSAIPNAPVMAPSNLQGGGGGVGQAAKDMARRQAGQAPSSVDQLSSGE